MKFKFFLIILFYLSIFLNFANGNKINLKNKKHKERRQLFGSDDKRCNDQCSKIIENTSNVNFCGIWKISCCSGTCLFEVCWGQRMILDC